MSAQGLLYRVSFDNQSVTSAAQDIVTFAASSAVPILIHYVKLTFLPTISSGLAQDVRAQLRWIYRTTAGSGGTALTPAPVNSRNTVTATGTYTQLVTTVGTAGSVKGAPSLESIIAPIVRVNPDEELLIEAGTTLALNLEAALGASYSASLEALVEEI